MGSNTNSESSDDIYISEKELDVGKCDEKFYDDHSSRQDVYPIQHCSPKAHVLILNNYEFTGVGNDRDGAKEDRKLMIKLWEGFQCKVEVKENQTAEAMLNYLADFSKSDKHEKCDFCVVIIMSHGGLGPQVVPKTQLKFIERFRNALFGKQENAKTGEEENGHSEVYGIDGKSIKIKDIVKLFLDCPLNGKPKLIFFQCCRGGAEAAGVPAASSVESDSMDKEVVTVPEGSDILVAYPTIEGYVSYRDPNKGSRFINAIAKVFSQKAMTEHVVDMLTEVGNEVSQRMVKRQMSEIVSRLRKKLYLYPGFPKQQKK
ncbi:caspase-2-like [Ciona intestinalis]